MGRLRSWWQYIRKHWIVALIIALVIAAMALILIESLINGTGFNGYYSTSTTRTISGSLHTITGTETYQPGKTLWDWMQLLFIPVALAIAGFWFNHRERKAAELRTEAERKIEEQRAKTEREIALDNQRETLFQTYLDRMSELLLNENLRKSKPENEVRHVAHARTLTILPQLDAVRKGSLIRFLYEAGLIVARKKDSVIDLSQAYLIQSDPRTEDSVIDLSGADLNQADLSGVKLSGVNLAHSNLQSSDLSMSALDGINLSFARLQAADLSYSILALSDLSWAYLQGANLINTELAGSDLTYADLSGADLSGANLGRANFGRAKLKGAFLVLTNLIGVDLSEVDLNDVDLKYAIVTEEQLENAKSLKGAPIPDGSIHP